MLRGGFFRSLSLSSLIHLFSVEILDADFGAVNLCPAASLLVTLPYSASRSRPQAPGLLPASRRDRAASLAFGAFAGLCSNIVATLHSGVSLRLTSPSPPLRKTSAVSRIHLRLHTVPCTPGDGSDLCHRQYLAERSRELSARRREYTYDSTTECAIRGPATEGHSCR